jgi:hypothetical protein
MVSRQRGLCTRRRTLLGVSDQLGFVPITLSVMNYLPETGVLRKRKRRRAPPKVVVQTVLAMDVHSAVWCRSCEQRETGCSQTVFPEKGQAALRTKKLEPDPGLRSVVSET